MAWLQMEEERKKQQKTVYLQIHTVLAHGTALFLSVSFFRTLLLFCLFRTFMMCLYLYHFVFSIADNVQ